MYGEEIHFGKLLLKLVVLNGFDTFNRGDPNRVPLLPRMDV